MGIMDIEATHEHKKLYEVLKQLFIVQTLLNGAFHFSSAKILTYASLMGL